VLNGDCGVENRCTSLISNEQTCTLEPVPAHNALNQYLVEKIGNDLPIPSFSSSSDW
jgi:hypothetical protein